MRGSEKDQRGQLLVVVKKGAQSFKFIYVRLCFSSSENEPKSQHQNTGFMLLRCNLS